MTLPENSQGVVAAPLIVEGDSSHEVHLTEAPLTAESLGKAAHTPGPWHRNIPPATKYVVVWSGRNTHVAKLANDSRVSAAEAEANINLIAAAPDLLEVLREIIGDGVHCDVVPHLHRKALAAIAKATA